MDRQLKPTNDLRYIVLTAYTGPKIRSAKLRVTYSPHPPTYQ